MSNRTAQDPDGTLDAILDILDRGEVVQAVSSKMMWLMSHRPPARPDAPSGEQLADLTSCSDPDEPQADPEETGQKF